MSARQTSAPLTPVPSPGPTLPTAHRPQTKRISSGGTDGGERPQSTHRRGRGEGGYGHGRRLNPPKGGALNRAPTKSPQGLGGDLWTMRGGWMFPNISCVRGKPSAGSGPAAVARRRAHDASINHVSCPLNCPRSPLQLVPPLLSSSFSFVSSMPFETYQSTVLRMLWGIPRGTVPRSCLIPSAACLPALAPVPALHACIGLPCKPVSACLPNHAPVFGPPFSTGTPPWGLLAPSGWSRPPSASKTCKPVPRTVLRLRLPLLPCMPVPACWPDLRACLCCPACLPAALLHACSCKPACACSCALGLCPPRADHHGAPSTPASLTCGLPCGLPCQPCQPVLLLVLWLRLLLLPCLPVSAACPNRPETPAGQRLPCACPACPACLPLHAASILSGRPSPTQQ